MLQEQQLLPKKPKTKRSRAGCLSCKKLHIKCDEARPSCEYCVHTGRECLYQDPKTKKISKRSASTTSTTPDTSPMTISPIAIYPDPITSLPETTSATDLIPSNTFDLIHNQSTLSLNSLTHQLNINKLELRLLKFFGEWGGEFYSFGVKKDIQKFWTVEVPKMWLSSDLIRTSVYAVSSVILWTHYELNKINDVYLEDDIIIDLDDTKLVLPNPVPLFSKTNDYFQNTLALLLKSTNESGSNDLDQAVGIIVAYISLFSVIAIHPYSPFPLVDYDTPSPDKKPVDMMEFCRMFRRDLVQKFHLLANSKFECLMYPDELKFQLPKTDDVFAVRFPVIEHLKYYFNMIDPSRYYRETGISETTINPDIYQSAIAALERMFHIAFKFNYVLPIYRAVLLLSSLERFTDLVRLKDYPAMKIMFYYACINSISDFKAFKVASVWDTFIEEFRELAFSKFNGEFEEVFDRVLYNTVCYFRDKKKSFRLDMLFKIGVDDPLLFEYYSQANTGGLKVCPISQV